MGTALVSVLAGVPMAPDQDYDQPITAWQHAMRPALPATASDEGNPGWGGLGGGSDSQQNDWSLGSSFGRGHFGEVISFPACEKGAFLAMFSYKIIFTFCEAGPPPRLGKSACADSFPLPTR